MKSFKKFAYYVMVFLAFTTFFAVSEAIDETIFGVEKAQQHRNSFTHDAVFVLIIIQLGAFSWYKEKKEDEKQS